MCIRDSPKAILHGDLNQKNALMTTDATEIIAIIDWDHCVYDYILTDIVTPINLFFEFTDEEKGARLKEAFLKPLEKKFHLEKADIKLIGEYQATKNKWQSIMFYANLIEELGDSTGELEQFTSNVKGEALKWVKIMECWANDSK